MKIWINEILFKLYLNVLYIKNTLFIIKNWKNKLCFIFVYNFTALYFNTILYICLKIIDSDDEDEESEEEIEDPHENSQEQEEENTNDELKEIDGRIINSYTTIDEFKLFRETVLFLKEKYVMIYNQWYDDYEDEDLIKLNDIIYTSRITISNNKEVINIPRKIVKIKKTQNLNGDNQNIDENMN